MKNIFYLASLLVLFLFGSCSNDDITESISETKAYTPTIQGVIGKFTKANSQPTTRSGVIEDNPNYAADGEQFYWVNGDEAKVLFFLDGDLNSTPTELTYRAVVPSGTKPSGCEFTAQGSIPAGNYTVYALYPAAGWSKDETGYKASMPQFNLIAQSDATSKHLGRAMFMKAKAANVAISGSSNSVNLSFKHLSSVVRCHVTDNIRPTPLTLIYLDLRLGNYNPYFKGNVDFFPEEAYLDGGIDGNSLTPIESSRSYYLSTHINQFFTDKGAFREFDVFMPVLPTGAPTNFTNHKLYIESSVSFYPSTSNMQDFGTFQYGLSFSEDIPFLQNGFEAGKSYYFNLKTE